MKIIKVILIVSLIIVIGYFFPVIMNEKTKLPNGTLMSRNRFTGQISIKLPNDEINHFSTDSPFYEEMLVFFRNH